MKKYNIFIFIFFVLINIYSFNLFDLSDDMVLVRVDDINITLLDFKIYSMGYKSIKIWNEHNVSNILNIMIMDLLFKVACEKENIYISESSLSFYAYKYFTDRSLSLSDPKGIQIYFDMNDPYYNLEDFMIKSTYNLYKVKYLAEKGEITNYKSYIIYFSNKNMNKKEKDSLKQKATSIVYEIMNGDTPFEDFVEKYSEDNFSKRNKGDVGLVNYEKYKNIFSKKEFDKVLKAGIFNPVLVEGKDGFYIFMHYDYEFSDDPKIVERILIKLTEKYKVIKMINFKTNKAN